MYNYKKVPEDRCVGVKCNKCGKQVKQGDVDDKPGAYAVHIKYIGGYFSAQDADKSGIEDGDCFEFDLCEICLGDLMRHLKISPSCTYLDEKIPWNGKSLAAMRKLYKK